MQMMPHRQKQPTSGPRFPRGLELCLCVTALSLVSYGILHHHTGGGAEAKASAPVVAQAPLPDVGDVHPPACKISPREMFLEQTLAAIEAEADADRREEMLSTLAGQIPVSDIALTLEELKNIGRGESDLSMRLLRRWAAADGPGAGAWSGQLPDGASREDALSDVAIEWGNVNPAAAAVWARQLPAAEEKQAALAAIANEAVRSNPVEALQLAAELPANNGRDDLARRAAMEWALQDAASAADWAGKIPETSLRLQVVAGIAVSEAESAPASAATLAIDSLPAGRLLDDTIISIVQRWAQQDPAGAAAWVEQFPEGTLRNTALQELNVLQANTLAATSQTLP